MPKKFIGYYRPHVGLFAADMVCALLIAAVDLLFPMVSRYAMQELLPHNSYLTFFAVMGALVAAYLLRAGFQYFVGYYGHLLGVRMEADMRQQLFAHLQTLPFKFYDKNRTGHLMSRVVNDLFEVVEPAHHGPEDVFISLVTLPGAFVILLTIEWKLALMIFALVPVVILFTAYRRRQMNAASRKVKERTAGINADIESSISGVRVAKAFGNEAYEMEKFNEGNNRYRVAGSCAAASCGAIHIHLVRVRTGYPEDRYAGTAGLPLRRFGRLPARYRQGVDGRRTGISSFSIFQTVFPGNGETAFVCQTMKNHVSRQGGSTPNWWTEGRFILTPLELPTLRLSYYRKRKDTGNFK